MWIDTKKGWYSNRSKEFLQWIGENFAPVVDKVMVRLFLSQAAVHQMHLLQMDVTTAFLYGETLQQIHVVLPDELRTQEEIEDNLVRKLLKSLYGTPDAPTQLSHKSFQHDN